MSSIKTKIAKYNYKLNSFKELIKKTIDIKVKAAL